MVERFQASVLDQEVDQAVQDADRILEQLGHLPTRLSLRVLLANGVALVSYETDRYGNTNTYSKKVPHHQVADTMVAMTKEGFGKDFPQVRGLNVTHEVRVSQDGERMFATVEITSPSGMAVRAFEATPRSNDERGYDALGKALAKGLEASIVVSTRV